MELTDYWKVLRAHWVSILAIAVLGTLVGFGWALLQPKVYTANASGIVSAGVGTDIGSAMAGENYAKSRVKSYLDLAMSRSVAASAAEATGLSDSPDALLTRVRVENPLDTATLKVSASAGTPEEARDLAEAWVVAIGDHVTELENSGAGADGAMSIVTFRSLDAAQLPSSPSSPNTKLAVAIGSLVGIVVAIGYALLRRVFDRRVHSTAEVEQETGMAVIGTIPAHKGFDDENRIILSTGGNDRSQRGADEYAVAESLRELRTNLQFMNIDDPPRKIVVTSALPGEGKSTVISNLANAIAASGRPVIVIDGDLRRPMLAKTFGLPEGAGLTDVLIGRAKIVDVLQPWGTSGKLFVLGAGKVPPNPSELLASKRLHSLLDELAELATVLIDAPPLLPVTDAAILTARTDGALVVTRARRTTYDELKAALANLGKVKARTLGIIINGVPMRGVSAEGYGYRYRSYYGRTATEPATEPAEAVPSAAQSAVPSAEAPAQPVKRSSYRAPQQSEPVTAASAGRRRARTAE